MDLIQKVMTSEEAAKEVAEQIIKILPTVTVMTASPTRSGRSIQVRVTWEELGKKQLGYFSVSALYGIRANDVKWMNFVRAAFRLDERMEDLAPGRGYHGQDLMDIFLKRKVTHWFMKFAKEAELKILAVIDSGKASKIRKSSKLKKAREYLTQALDHVLKEGLSDTEVRDLLREAMVRNTMET